MSPPWTAPGRTAWLTAYGGVLAGRSDRQGRAARSRQPSGRAFATRVPKLGKGGWGIQGGVEEVGGAMGLPIEWGDHCSPPLPPLVALDNSTRGRPNPSNRLAAALPFFCLVAVVCPGCASPAAHLPGPRSLSSLALARTARGPVVPPASRSRRVADRGAVYNGFATCSSIRRRGGVLSRAVSAPKSPIARNIPFTGALA